MNTDSSQGSLSGAVEGSEDQQANQAARQEKRQELIDLLVNKFDVDKSVLNGMSLEQLKDQLSRQRGVKAQEKIDENKKGTVVSTEQPLSLADRRSQVFLENFTSGSSNELLSGISMPGIAGYVDGKPYFETSTLGLLNLGDNMNRVMDLNKEKVLTKLRGNISKELANIDAMRSYRENLRSTAFASLSNV